MVPRWTNFLQAVEWDWQLVTKLQKSRSEDGLIMNHKRADNILIGKEHAVLMDNGYWNHSIIGEMHDWQADYRDECITCRQLDDLFNRMGKEVGREIIELKMEWDWIKAFNIMIDHYLDRHICPDNTEHIKEVKATRK